MDALRRGDYMGARQAADLGMSAAPDDPRYQVLAAEAYLGLGDHTSALSEALAALVRNDLTEPLRGRAHRVASEAFEVLGEPVEAALHGAHAAALGALENDLVLRERLRLGADRALDEGRPGDALVLVRRLSQLRSEAGEPPGDLDDLVLATGLAATRQLVELGRYDQAFDILDELDADFSQALDLRFLKGVVQLRLGRYDEAEATFDSYLMIPGPPDQVERLHAIAEAHIELLEWERAAARYEQAIAAHPDSAESYLGLARVYLATSRTDLARAALDTYLERAEGDEGLAAAVLAVADLTRTAGRDDLALAYLEEAQLRTDDFSVTAALAEAYLRREQSARAEAAVRDYVDRASDRAAAAEAAGRWTLARLQPERAVAFFREAVAVGGPPERLQRALAEAYAALGWDLELVAAVDAWVEAVGDSPEVRREAAELLGAGQLWDEAARMLEPAYAENPSDATIVSELATAYFFAGQPDREAEIYRAAYDISAEPGEQALHIAEQYRNRNAYGPAVEWLTTATHHDETRAAALLELGRVHQLLGDEAEMWAAYETYLAESGNDLGAYETVLEGFAGPRHAREAANLLERMIALDPTHPDLRLRRANRLLDLGDLAAALEAFVDYMSAAHDPAVALEASANAMRREQHLELVSPFVRRVSELYPDLPSLAWVSGRYTLLRAQRARAEGDFEAAQAYRAQARRDFANYLASSPTDRGEVIRAAGEMATAGLFDTAVAAYRRAIALGSQPAELGWSYAAALIQTGQEPDRAVEVVRAELRSAPYPLDMASAAADGLAANGHVEAALQILEAARRRVDDDRSRMTLFRTGAELLLSAGRGVELDDLADRFVLESRDRLAALLLAADVLAQGGRVGPAREHLETALEMAPGRADVIAAMARVDYLSGDLETGLRRFEAATRSRSWAGRAWSEYARFFLAHGELDAALEAFQAAREAGEPSPDVALATGQIEARQGRIEPAIAAFDAGLDRSRTDAQRVQVMEQVLAVLGEVGRFDQVDQYLERALVDPALRAHFTLEAADLAYRRGDLDRGGQMVRAWIDDGGSLAPAIALEIENGLLARPVSRIGRAVVEAEPVEATRLLERFHDSVVAFHGASTLALWVDQLAGRSGRTGPIALNLAAAQAWLDEGAPDQALPILHDLSHGEATVALLAAVVEMLAGRPESAEELVEASLAGERPEPTEEQLLAAWTTMAVLSGPAEAERISGRLAQADGSLSVRLARLDWLLERQRPLDALDVYGTLTWGADDRSEGSSVSEAATAAIEAFGDYGYADDAATLAMTLAAGSDVPDDSLRLATRLLFEAGQDARAGEQMDAYRRVAGDYPPALLALAREVAEAGRLETTIELSSPLVAGATVDIARASLSAAIRAGVLSGRLDATDGLAERFVGRPGGHYPDLVWLAGRYDQAYDWLRAGRMYGAAAELLPGREGPFAGLLRSRYLTGQMGPVLARFEDSPRPVENPEALRAALRTGAVGLMEPAERLDRAEARLRFEPGSASRLIEVEVARGAPDLETLRALAGREPLLRQQVLSALEVVRVDIATRYAAEVVDDPEVDPNSLRQAARLLVESGRAEEAAEALRRAADESAGADLATERVAREAYQLGLFDLALELSERALTTPVHTGLARGLALASRARVTGELPEGLDESLARQLPPAAMLPIIEALLAIDQTGEAERLAVEWARIPALDQGGRVTLPHLGGLLGAYVRADRADAAWTLVETHFPELLRHPRVIPDVRPLAEVLRHVEGVAAAEQVYRGALAHAPNDVDLLTGLALLLAEEPTRLDEAEAAARRALAQSATPDAVPLAALGRIVWLEGRRPDGLAALRTAVRLLDPERPEEAAWIPRLSTWLE